MKHILCIVAIITCLLLAHSTYAQDTVSKKKKKLTTLSIGEKGMQITSVDTTRKNEEKESTGRFETHWGMLDLGLNTIKDNTNYNSPAVKTFLNVPDNTRNAALFNIRQSKSINVNIYPWLETFKALDGKNQKIFFTTGIGLQLYNFRYENPITFTHTPNSVVLETTSFKKDKLGFDYLHVPLMVTFKTRITKDKWLIYGAGITAGYSIATWTKQESDGGGKVKMHNSFDFANFNNCVTAEIGFTDIRFYATYQLTNMYNSNSGMDQRPISFGIRFLGI